jgi:hypothetical protein
MDYVTNSLVALLVRASVYLFIGYVLGKALTLNKKAKVIESGTMIFEFQKGYRIIGIAFLMFAGFLLFQANSNTITDFMDLFIATILISIFIILGALVIVMSLDVVEVSSEKIRNYNIIGIGKEKVIFWEAIDDINYDKFYKSIKIVSDKTKINLGIERSGFYDFIALLRTRYGNTIYGISFDDICNDIKKFKKFPIN